MDCVEVEGLVAGRVRHAVGAARHHLGDLGLEFVPGGGGEGARDVVVLAVDHQVPHGVELIGTVVVGESDGVAALVAFGEVVRVKVGVVQRLHEVTHVVDEQTERVGFLHVGVAGVQVGADVRVDVGVQVIVAIVSLGEPLDEVLDAGQVLVVLVDLVVGRLAIGEEASVQEVEVALPGVAVVLVVVSKGSALNEGVLILMHGDRGVVLLEVGQHREGLIEGAGGVLLEKVLCDVSGEQMSVDGPSNDAIN